MTQNIEELITRLHNQKIKLWVEGERLRYSVPKGQESKMAALRTELSERKAEIITFLKQASQSVQLKLQPISRDQDLPLSFAQQRLWFLAQFDNESAPYNESVGLKITGSLQVDVLEQSLTEIVQRHEILRTTFHLQNGVPYQNIGSCWAVTIPVIDLRALSEPEQSSAVRRLAAEENQQSFDLTHGPLLRVTLLRLPDIESHQATWVPKHILLSTMHHIICDMWSMRVFVRELSTLYNNLLRGKPSPLFPLPIQYADFAHWQRQWLIGDVLESQLNYWKQQLAEAPALLELPTDFPRPPVQRFRGARLPITLSSELIKQIKQLNQQAGTSLFMTLLSAFTVLLSRYSGQNDIVIGSPIANRTQSQTESLIGFFVNTLALRINWSGKITFEELLNRVKVVAVEAYTHQDIPFEKLVEELQPERNLSHTPLFQVMLVLRNVPIDTLKLTDLTLAPLERENVIAKFDLTLELTEVAEGMKGSFEYNTDLFQPATIERLSTHFQTLLTGIVTQPQAPIHELPLLTTVELQQLKAWNETTTDYPADKCLHHLFEAQVARTPDATALVFEDQQLTYRELNIQANQLAHFLWERAVKPEVLVGICLERSLSMVVGLLGILKAGGAYLPLDPTYPAARLAFMLEDAQVPVLLTQSSLKEELPKTKAQVVCLDAEAKALSRLSAENVVSGVEPANLAYVIYTSGSTGNPKAVQISHSSLLNFLTSMRQQIGLTTQDVLLAITTLSFDIAALEIYLPLLIGAKIVLVPREKVNDGLQLLEKLNHHGITIMQATPATWHLLLTTAWETSPQLKILCGGEALPAELAKKLLEKGQILWNLYGPTETTIWSTIAQVSTVTSNMVPIGRPLANTQVHILDQYLQPVPIGVPGELHIGGAGLARGYLNRPDLTAEKFIPDPFSDEKNARLYKTGDLARYLPDGNIEYLGRMDNQIKLRGFRIELGEIERVLGQYPSMQECAVIICEKTLDDQRLVAYMVPKLKPVIKTEEVRAFLKKRLPDYMIPAAFTSLETMPLTPNGKIDRQELIRLSVKEFNLSPDTNFLAPRTRRELRLTRLWEQVLDIHPIGVNDNFFDIGGHSFLAVKLISSINKEFDSQLPLATLFQNATIAKMASLLRNQLFPQKWSSLVSIQPQGSKTPIFCMHPAGGTVFRYTMLAHFIGYDRPFYGLQGKGIEPGHEPHANVEEMAAAYVEEVQSVQPHGPYILAGWSSGGTTAFEMALRLEKSGQQVPLVIMMDTPAPFECSYETDDIKFLLERLPAQGIYLEDLEKYDSYEDKLAYIFEEIKRANPFIDLDLAKGKHFLNVYKHHNKIMCDYQPMGQYTGKIIFFKATESLPYDSRMGEPIEGWKKLAAGGIEVEKVPGNHFNILEAFEGRVLAEKMKAHLENLAL